MNIKERMELRKKSLALKKEKRLVAAVKAKKGNQRCYQAILLQTKYGYDLDFNPGYDDGEQPEIRQ